MINTLNLWQEDWLLYHKTIFDGINRLIIVTPGTSSISIKQDIYSSWKEWAQLRDHAKFLPAVRTTGGDPVGGGEFTGDAYFLINGWRIYVNQGCDIVGNIYSDDYPSPYVTVEGANIVRSTVSSLTQSLGFTGTVDADNNLIAEAVWNYLMTDITSTGTMGDRMKKLLTVAKFLGLK